MRNLVSIKNIDSIEDIPGADFIVAANIGGWKAVVKRDEFKPGEKIAYFEIDSFLPVGVPAFDFLTANSTRTVIHPDTNEEVTGTILRTKTLRGVVSQGLILSLDVLGLTENDTQAEIDAKMNALGVFKYEPPIPAGMGGTILGKFPEAIVRKTDSERVQNLDPEFFASLNREDWVATEKIDGTSSTFIKEDGRLRIASRNWELSLDNGGVLATIANALNLVDIMPDGVTIQGEIFGPGIQKNRLQVAQVRLAIFNVKAEPDAVLTPEFEAFVNTHKVPVLDWTLPATITDAVEQVFGMTSFVNPKVQAEGVVWWNKKDEAFAELGHRPNFKAINNKFLAKAKD